MSKRRRVAVVCIDPWDGDAPQFRPFNFGARRIQASLIASDLDLDVHFIESDQTDVDAFVARVEEVDPDVVGASTYVWSLPTFAEMARRLKRSNPDRSIVFGGPSARPERLMLGPYRDLVHSVDALVLGEGETIFNDIMALPRIDRASLAKISGLSLPTPNGWETTGPPTRETSLDDLPSPLQMGLLDNVMTGHLQTFRGCPLACSFCQWGDAEQSTRVCSIETLVKELAEMKRRGVGSALFVDAALNLNPRAFRNLMAADNQVNYFQGATILAEIYPSHLRDNHLELLERARSCEIGVGLQSYDPAVLRRMHRHFEPERFEHVVRRLDEFAYVTIEVILGLPGDTPESFRNTLRRALELGVSVRAYHCLVLPDALMTRAPPGISMNYDPVSLKMISCTGWSEADLQRTTEWMTEITVEANGVVGPGFWTLRTETGRRRNAGEAYAQPIHEHVHVHEHEHDEPESKPDVGAELRGLLAAAMHAATADDWRINEISWHGDRLRVDVETSERPFTLEIEQGEGPAFCRVDRLRFGYRSDSSVPGRRDLARLEAVCRVLAPPLARVFADHSVPQPTRERVSLPVV